MKTQVKAQKSSEKVILRLENVWKIYKMGAVEVPALRGISLDIKQGDFVAITGASGSGKSTLMNLMGCLDTPSRGHIYLKTQDISTLTESDLASFRGSTIGFVFQQYNLIPSMSAFENVLLPLEFLEYSDEDAARRAKDILHVVGLGDRMHHRPTELSGGQQQRVSVARSLAGNPEILLADEPSGALDSVTGKKIMELLCRLWIEEGKTIIMITHELALAKYARVIVELKDGQIIKITENESIGCNRLIKNEN
ncbi:MAG: ABC transporter ATP-binding protein [Nanoarchaeota archaeon]|nr:ABC transporter ATP-binding protein [Nanoarchaeota archaeon]MBU4299987.1 ABC transporter ATP-binding protein [Nanoarchaeota archaeon]MBU4451225.1 ABC transporter ATP-binding protein [Nanoarchaeota archaeon]MCG2724081.1 ABC transporter ATP-binding protein [archaeon]